MNPNPQNWEELKKYLLAVQQEFEDRNGRDSCKNCGMDYKWLIKKFEVELKLERGRTIRELDAKYNKLCEEKVNEALDVVKAREEFKRGVSTPFNELKK